MRIGSARRGLLAFAATVALLPAGASAASAHVLVESVAPGPDGTAVLALTFDHGCDGQPTTGLDVRLPEGVTAVSATGPAGEPAEVSARRVSWSGTPVPDGTPGRMEVVVRITGTPGQTFTLPTRQDCAGGDGYDWTETQTQSLRPAPMFVATGAVLSAGPAGTEAVPPAGRGAAGGRAAGSGASLPSALAAAGVLTVGLATAGPLLVRRLRRRLSP